MGRAFLRRAAPSAFFAALAWAVARLVSPTTGWIVFCIALFAQLAFHWRHSFLLDRWLSLPGRDFDLEGRGVWDGIFRRFYRHEKGLRDTIARRERRIGMLVAAIQALTDGVILLDAQNRILFCNATAEGQLGLQTRADRGQPVMNLVRQPEFVAFLRAADFSRPLTLRPERNPGRTLSIYIVPYAENRRLMQIKDVTQSETLDRTRRDFVANVSHELRTPLTVLAGFLETLREIELDGEDRQRYLELMSEQSTRMLSIVQDLLALSSIESAPPPEDEIVDMASVIDTLRRDAESLSAGRHTLIVEAADGLDLRGSEQELLGAFGNLVANAVRYTPEGGRVRIVWQAGAGETASGAEFSVHDTGVGIEAQHIPRLTERFYRVDRGRSREAGGTGLGLAIVKHTLNRHQAQLDIRSTPGQGSIFIARFPARRVVHGEGSAR